MSTDERMEKIEGQLARVRWFNRCLIACIVLSLGGWLILKTFTPETVWAQSGFKEIRANSFVLEDANGKIRAHLILLKEGPRLALYDENNKPRTVLSLTKKGPGLHLLDGNGRVGLCVIKEGPVWHLTDENGKTRVGVGVTKDGPVLHLLDGNGRVIWQAP